MSREAIEAVRNHYEASSIDQPLLLRVQELLQPFAGTQLTTCELTGLDQLHVRGYAATRQLAELAKVAAGMRVLDAGSGLGGPARYLAENNGCDVTGVDLAPSFVAVANYLNQRTGLEARVRFEVGDLTHLPFPDATFDLVWTQHVVMNIPDRDRLYREFRRVLRPEGKLAFYDALAIDPATEVLYPTPWAGSNATSFLLTEAQTRHALERAGLSVVTWKDVTLEAAEWASQPPQAPASGLTLPALLGPGLGIATRNFGKNIQEGRVRLVMAVCSLANSLR